MKDLCEDCPSDLKGTCCFNSVLIEGHNIVLSNHPCKFLDLKTMDCSIYNERYLKNRNCINIEQAIARGGLPVGCLYLGNATEDELKRAKIYHIPDNLSNRGRQTYDLMNDSAHQFIVNY